ncbi:MAG: hypothetical protein JXR70_08180 [Spirochaetales bacterium]|nr:hypothetical protein [Spirochaetales bacterium]
MVPFIKKYLRILQIELEDLEEDINFLIETHQKRVNSKEITQYVFNENLAVLKNEIFAVERFEKMAAEIKSDDYNTIEDFIADLKIRYKKRLKDSGLAEAVYPLVERKLDKVYKFVALNQ